MSSGIIDLLIRIKNGYQAQRETITSPNSRFKKAVLTKLQGLGFIESFEEGDANHKEITIHLKYDHGQPAMSGLKLKSRPGMRWYVSYTQLKPVVSGVGFSVISTPKGLVTDREAKKQKLGGELLFEIW